MIEQLTFLGMPLRTQLQRRMLVGMYYALLVLLLAAALWKPKPGLMFMLPQLVTLGGLLGGIRKDGPVKAYSSSSLPMEMQENLTSLDLSGAQKSRQDRAALDERETVERDHAHFLAYRVLIVTLTIVVLLVTGAFTYAPVHAEAVMATRGAIVLCTLVIYAISLPQSVLLWTQPDPPADELFALPRAAQ